MHKYTLNIKIMVLLLPIMIIIKIKKLLNILEDKLFKYLIYYIFFLNNLTIYYYIIYNLYNQHLNYNSITI